MGNKKHGASFDTPCFCFLSVFAVLLSDGLDPAVSRSGSRIGSGRTGGSYGMVAARAVISASAASVAVLISAASVSAGRSGAAVEGLHAIFESYNDLAVILGTDGVRGYALNILESRVNDASLIGIHGIKHNISAVLSDLCGALLSECAQGCLALLTVVADVERDSSRLVRASVDNKADEILDSVECLSPAADSCAVVAVIFDRDTDFFVSLFDLYLCALDAEACKNFSRYSFAPASDGAS